MPIDIKESDIASFRPLRDKSLDDVEQNSGIMGDIGTALNMGATVHIPNAIAGIVDIVNPTDVSVAQTIGDWGLDERARRLQAEYSPATREALDNVRQAREASEARGDSLGGQVVSTLGAYAANPLAAGIGIVETLPEVLMPGGAAVKAGKAARGAVAARRVSDKIAKGAYSPRYTITDKRKADLIRRSANSKEAVQAGERAFNFTRYAGEGALMAGHASKEITDYNAEHPETRGANEGTAMAIPVGILGGATSYAIGRTPLGDVESAIFKRSADHVPFTPAAKNVVAPAGKFATLKAAAGEGGEEILQTIPETGLTNVATEQPWDKGIGYDATEAAVMGSAMGGALHTASNMPQHYAAARERLAKARSAIGDRIGFAATQDRPPVEPAKPAVSVTEEAGGIDPSAMAGQQSQAEITREAIRARAQAEAERKAAEAAAAAEAKEQARAEAEAQRQAKREEAERKREETAQRRAAEKAAREEAKVQAEAEKAADAARREFVRGAVGASAGTPVAREVAKEADDIETRTRGGWKDDDDNDIGLVSRVGRAARTAADDVGAKGGERMSSQVLVAIARAVEKSGKIDDESIAAEFDKKEAEAKSPVVADMYARAAEILRGNTEDAEAFIKRRNQARHNAAVEAKVRKDQERKRVNEEAKARSKGSKSKSVVDPEGGEPDVDPDAPVKTKTRPRASDEVKPIEKKEPKRNPSGSVGDWKAENDRGVQKINEESRKWAGKIFDEHKARTGSIPTFEEFKEAIANARNERKDQSKKLPKDVIADADYYRDVLGIKFREGTTETKAEAEPKVGVTPGAVGKPETPKVEVEPKKEEAKPTPEAVPAPKTEAKPEPKKEDTKPKEAVTPGKVGKPAVAPKKEAPKPEPKKPTAEKPAPKAKPRAATKPVSKKTASKKEPESKSDDGASAATKEKLKDSAPRLFELMKKELGRAPTADEFLLVIKKAKFTEKNEIGLSLPKDAPTDPKFYEDLGLKFSKIDPQAEHAGGTPKPEPKADAEAGATAQPKQKAEASEDGDEDVYEDREGSGVTGSAGGSKANVGVGRKGEQVAAAARAVLRERAREKGWIRNKDGIYEDEFKSLGEKLRTPEGKKILDEVTDVFTTKLEELIQPTLKYAHGSALLENKVDAVFKAMGELGKAIIDIATLLDNLGFDDKANLPIAVQAREIYALLDAEHKRLVGAIAAEKKAKRKEAKAKKELKKHPIIAELDSNNETRKQLQISWDDYLAYFDKVVDSMSAVQRLLYKNITKYAHTDFDGNIDGFAFRLKDILTSDDIYNDLRLFMSDRAAMAYAKAIDSMQKEDVKFPEDIWITDSSITVDARWNNIHRGVEGDKCSAKSVGACLTIYKRPLSKEPPKLKKNQILLDTTLENRNKEQITGTISVVSINVAPVNKNLSELEQRVTEGSIAHVAVHELSHALQLDRNQIEKDKSTREARKQFYDAVKTDDEIMALTKLPEDAKKDLLKLASEAKQGSVWWRQDDTAEKHKQACEALGRALGISTDDAAYIAHPLWYYLACADKYANSEYAFERDGALNEFFAIHNALLVDTKGKRIYNKVIKGAYDYAARKNPEFAVPTAPRGGRYGSRYPSHIHIERRYRSNSVGRADAGRIAPLGEGESGQSQGASTESGFQGEAGGSLNHLQSGNDRREGTGGSGSSPQVERAATTRRVLRFSKIKNPKIRAAAETLGNALYNFSLGALFTEDLKDIGQKYLPRIKQWYELVRKTSAARNHWQSTAVEISHAYQKLDKKTQDRVNKYLARATLSEVWGYYEPEAFKTRDDYMKYLMKLSDAQLDAHEELQAEFGKLPLAARNVIKSVFRRGIAARRMKADLLLQSTKKKYDDVISRAKTVEQLEKLEKERDEHINHITSMIGDFSRPYAPIRRFGTHAVVLRSKEYIDIRKAIDEEHDRRAAGGEVEEEDKLYLKGLKEELHKMERDENHYRVEFHESYGKARMRERELQRDGVEVQAFARNEFSQSMVPAWAKLEQVMLSARREQEEMHLSGNTRKALDAIENMATYMYIEALSDDNARKRELHRRGVAGYNENMMENFLQSTRSEANLFAHLKYGSQARQTLIDMDSDVRGSKDRASAADIFNEVIRRHNVMMEDDTPKAVNAILRTTSMYMLMLNPMYYVQNLTQPLMMTAPYLAGKFGSKAFGRITTTMKDVALRMNNDLELKSLKGYVTDEEYAVLEEIRDNGRIDVGMSMDFGDLDGGNVLTRVSDKLGGYARRVEAINRIASFLAAYRLAREGGMNGKDAKDYADKALQVTHGDYSASNAPRYFRMNSVAKVVSQFRKFQLIQIGMLARMVKDGFAGASKEERDVARAQLGYILGVYSLSAGALGTPIVSTALWLFAKALGEDGEDEEDTVRRLIDNKDVSDVLLRGLPRMIGVDLSEKLGAGSIFTPLRQWEYSAREGSDNWARLVTDAAGPWATMGERLMTAASQFSSGNIWKGIETMMPNGIPRNALQVPRLFNEGYTNKAGDVLIKPENYDVVDAISQLMGLQPAEITDRHRVQGSVIRSDEARSKEYTALAKQYREAARDGDTKEMRKLRAKWAEANKKWRERGYKTRSITDLVNEPMNQRNRERNASGGVLTTDSNRRAIEGLLAR